MLDIGGREPRVHTVLVDGLHCGRLTWRRNGRMRDCSLSAEGPATGRCHFDTNYDFRRHHDAAVIFIQEVRNSSTL